MKPFALVITALIFIGCAAGISKQGRSQVTFQDSFSTFQKQSKDLIGETVLFGGKIITTQNDGRGTELTILQLPLNRLNRPLDNDQSQGRFLVGVDRFLDPAIYTKGNSVTVVGKLVVIENRRIGEMTYAYPKLEAHEIKLWQPDEGWMPRFRFGIGIGTTF